MVSPYQIEQVEAVQQEAARQQLENRLAEVQAADAASANQAAAARPESEAMRAQLGERAMPGQVEAEAHLRAMERGALEKTAAAPADMARPTDQQVQEATEALQNIPELRTENWARLDDAQRLEVLRGVESKMAAIQGRPPVEVRAEPMEPGVYGGYNRGDGVMRISQEHLRSNDTREIADTVVHEGRHAYQHYAVEHPGFHPNQAEVASWRWNMQSGNYLRPEISGQRAYQRQPVEADAWNYANRIVRNVMGGPR